MHLFDCSEQLRLLAAYHEAIIRCYGRPNGLALKGKAKDDAFNALVASLSAYQMHVQIHRCVPHRTDVEGFNGAGQVYEQAIPTIEHLGQQRKRVALRKDLFGWQKRTY